MPASASLTTSSGLLINFFMISPLVLDKSAFYCSRADLSSMYSNHYNDDGGCICICIATGAFSAAICPSIALR